MTVVQVSIASPNVIVSIYLLLYVPLAMLWAALHHYGVLRKYYLTVLPLTMCMFFVGMDLVNQSLSALMRAPMGVTAVHGLSLLAVAGLWAGAAEAARPTCSWAVLWALAKWTLAAVLYAASQLANHEVAFHCSLSERIVILNLSPLLAYAVESSLPAGAKLRGSFEQRAALCFMVLGAVLFGLQYPNFTVASVTAASSLLLATVPLRLVQRCLLAELMQVPIPLAAAYDGLALSIPSTALSTIHQDGFWGSWHVWLRDPTIVLMLALSGMTFVGGHLTCLMMLKVSSATSVLVFASMSNFAVVFVGIIWFSDAVVQNPLSLVGLSISLIAGLCYSALGQRSAQEQEKDGVGSAAGALGTARAGEVASPATTPPAQPR